MVLMLCLRFPLSCVRVSVRLFVMHLIRLIRV